MRDNRAAFDGQPGITYLPYVETESGAGRGLLGALAAQAAVVVTDDFPCFFLPAMIEAAGRQLDVRLEAVDSNGLLPMRAVSTVFPTAHAFRRVLQKTLPAHLKERPAVRARSPSRSRLPAWAMPAQDLVARWPDVFTWLDGGGAIEQLPIDHAVRPTDLAGGAVAARERLGVVRRSRTRRPTATSATCPIAMPPAGCRPICTGGISARTRCSSG